jgi:glycosyltransferase involved in cell wall biosynthesis
MNPHLSIVIPAYNEAKILPVTLECLRVFLSERAFKAEVIIVDDGSTDKTSAVLQEWTRAFECLRVLRTSVNLGKGASIRRGVLSSRGKCVFVADADLPGRPEDISRLLEALDQGAAVAIASRRPSSISAAPSPTRYIASKIYRGMVRVILGLPVRDTQCGFKAFLREPLSPIVEELRSKGFSFDVEFLFAAWKRGLPIKEVEFDVVERRPIQHAILLQSPRMMIDLLRIRLTGGRVLRSATTRAIEPKPSLNSTKSRERAPNPQGSLVNPEN